MLVNHGAKENTVAFYRRHSILCLLLTPPPPGPPHSVLPTNICSSIFWLFSQMDPVQKAVINHTFGVPLIKTKRPVISCNVCQIRFNSEVPNMSPFSSCRKHAGSCHFCTYALHILHFFPPSVMECVGGPHPIF